MVNVSIVIPVYNAQNYLNQCIDSCVNQTLKDIEIILVDDASNDNSREIINHYCKFYPEKIVALFLKNNMKQGAARNRGIKIAKGEYLCFVDADDYIDQTMCEKLYTLCMENDLDIASANGYKIQDNKFRYYNTYKSYDFTSNKSIIHFTSQCYKLIKKDIIVKNKMFYPENTYHEDTAVVPLWYMLGERKKLLNEPLYFRRIHSSSTTHSLDINGISQILSVLEILVKNAKRVGLYDGNNRELLDDFIFSRILHAAKLFLKNKSEYAHENLQELSTTVKIWKKYIFDESLFFNHITKMDYNLAIEFIRDFNKFIEWDWKRYVDINKKVGYPDRINKINQLLAKIQTDKKKIIVWGAGQRCVPLISTIKRCGVEYYVGDNNSDLWNSEIETGDKVRDSYWLKNNVEDPVFLILAEEYYDEIINCLEKVFGRVISIDLNAYLMYDLDPDLLL